MGAGAGKTKKADADLLNEVFMAEETDSKTSNPVNLFQGLLSNLPQDDVCPFVYSHDPLQKFMGSLIDTKATQNRLRVGNRDFENKNQCPAEEEDDGLLAGRLSLGNHYLHNYFGGFYSIQTMYDEYEIHDSKKNHGFIDSRQLQRKTFIKKFGQPEGVVSIPFPHKLNRMMADSSIAAFSVKGNEQTFQKGQIACDYLVIFNKEIRVCLLTEGEGPFDAQVRGGSSSSATSAVRGSVIFLSKSILKRKGLKKSPTS